VRQSVNQLVHERKLCVHWHNVYCIKWTDRSILLTIKQCLPQSGLPFFSLNFSNQNIKFKNFSFQIALTTGNPSQPHSPEHLVNRKDLLERMGLPTATGSRHSRGHPASRSIGGTGEFSPQWTMDLGPTSSSTSRANFRGQSSRSIDRISISSHESQASGGAISESSSSMSNYDTPKAVISVKLNNLFYKKQHLIKVILLEFQWTTIKNILVNEFPRLT